MFILPLAHVLCCKIQSNLLTQRPDKITANIVYILLEVTVIISLLFIPIYFAWSDLGIWFTRNMDILNRTNSMLWFYAIVFILYQIQTIFQQILRATGYTWDLFG